MNRPVMCARFSSPVRRVEDVQHETTNERLLVAELAALETRLGDPQPAARGRRSDRGAAVDFSEAQTEPATE